MRCDGSVKWLSKTHAMNVEGNELASKIDMREVEEGAERHREREAGSQGKSVCKCRFVLKEFPHSNWRPLATLQGNC